MDLKTLNFSLSEEEIKESEKIYRGRVIKFLITPFHTFNDLKEVFNNTPQVVLFPERDLNYYETKQYIKNLLISEKIFVSEILIVTSNFNILKDAIRSSSRVLDFNGKVQPCHIEGFGLAVNIHTLDLEVFSEFGCPKKYNYGEDLINNIITEVNESESLDVLDQERLMCISNNIGEEIIRDKIVEMILDKSTPPPKLLSSVQVSPRFSSLLEKKLETYPVNKRERASTLYINLALLEGEDKVITDHLK
jgi:hypothetical protein